MDAQKLRSGLWQSGQLALVSRRRPLEGHSGLLNAHNGSSLRTHSVPGCGASCREFQSQSPLQRTPPGRPWPSGGPWAPKQDSKSGPFLARQGPPMPETHT